MTKKDMLIAISLFLTSVTALSGCASPGKKTAIGAGAGGATGAAIGGATGGWEGAGVGAAVGAAVGGAFGNILDRQSQELAEVADTRRTKEGILVNLKNDLLFQTNSAVLKDEATTNISKLGDILAKYPEDRIKIEGHTDNVGPDRFNEELSVRRAEAVRNVLQSRGVKENQIIVLGKGEAEPVASNASTQGRSLNRRVELHIDIPQAVS